MTIVLQFSQLCLYCRKEAVAKQTDKTSEELFCGCAPEDEIRGKLEGI